MKCGICRNGNTSADMITVVLEKEGTTLVFKGVPAEICDNCGEEYVSSSVNKELLRKALEASLKGADLELLRYAA